MEATLNTSTWRKQSVGNEIRVDCDRAWATYDADGSRLRVGEGALAPSADLLAQWDTEAPAQAFVILAEAKAEAAAREQANRGIKARFGGTCAKSGVRYGKGARIESTMYGWALVSAELDISYNMSREDSPL